MAKVMLIIKDRGDNKASVELVSRPPASGSNPANLTAAQRLGLVALEAVQGAVERSGGKATEQRPGEIPGRNGFPLT